MKQLGAIRRAGAWAFCIAFGAMSTTAEATTVVNVEVHCPVCAELFIDSQVASYSTFGSSGDEIRLSPHLRVVTCPHCAYSAVEGSFGEMPPENREVLGDTLTNLVLRLSPLEREVAGRLRPDERRLRDRLAGAFVARECRHRLPTDDAEDLRILWVLYDAACRPGDAALRSHYRDELTAKLAAELDAGRYQGNEAAAQTITLAKLQGLAGRTNEALRLLDRVERLTRPSIRLLTRPDQERADIREAAFGAACRLRFRTYSIAALRSHALDVPPPAKQADARRWIQSQVALQELARRHEPEAWQVLADFAMRDFAHLDTLTTIVALHEEDVRRCPGFHDWLRKQHRLATWALERAPANAGSWSDGLWARRRVAGRLSRLFPGTGADGQPQPDDVRTVDAALGAGATNIELGATNTMGAEWRTLSALRTLVVTGNLNAIRHFLKWTAPRDGCDVGDTGYLVAEIVGALAAQTQAWTLPPRPVGDPDPHRLLVWSSLAALQGDRSAARALAGLVPETNNAVRAIALAALTGARSDAAKNECLRILRPREHRVCLDVADYLALICGPSDLAALDGASRDGYRARPRDPFDRARSCRQEVESVMASIRLREILTRTLQAGSPAAPAGASP